MLVAIGNFCNYRVQICYWAPLWLADKPCPLVGARMASILHRMQSEEIVYVGY